MKATVTPEARDRWDTALAHDGVTLGALLEAISEFLENDEGSPEFIFTVGKLGDVVGRAREIARERRRR